MKSADLFEVFERLGQEGKPLLDERKSDLPQRDLPLFLQKGDYAGSRFDAD